MCLLRHFRSRDDFMVDNDDNASSRTTHGIVTTFLKHNITKPALDMNHNGKKYGHLNFPLKLN